MIRLHASCVAIEGAGILLRGPSGAGKSDLALRLIEGGARLVADDQVELAAEDGRLTARPPAALSGLLEVRGLGIVRIEPLPAADLALVVDMALPGSVERMPLPAPVTLLGLSLAYLRVVPWEASAPAKVRLALKVATGGIMLLQ